MPTGALTVPAELVHSVMKFVVVAVTFASYVTYGHIVVIFDTILTQLLPFTIRLRGRTVFICIMSWLRFLVIYRHLTLCCHSLRTWFLLCRTFIYPRYRTGVFLSRRRRWFWMSRRAIFRSLCGVDIAISLMSVVIGQYLNVSCFLVIRGPIVMVGPVLRAEAFQGLGVHTGRVIVEGLVVCPRIAPWRGWGPAK